MLTRITLYGVPLLAFACLTIQHGTVPYVAAKVITYKQPKLDDRDDIHLYRNLPALTPGMASGRSCRSNAFGSDTPRFIEDAFVAALEKNASFTDVRIFGPLYGGPDNTTCFVITGSK